MTNYSRQREAILRMLLSTTAHPTAEEVYAEVKKVIPNISLGTVYRNLRALVENKEALVIRTEGGKDHFDGSIIPHAHFNCVGCDKVSDVFLTEGQLKNIHSINPNDFELNFTGICNECLKNKINNNQ